MRKYNIAPDGSCLFAAIDFLCTGECDSAAPPRLRAQCAEVILANQNVYSEVRLGKNPVEYAQWIQMWDSYGGETEILILCDLYEVEISIASLESRTVLTYKPSVVLKDHNKNRRIYLLYNGQHYNAVVDGSEEKRIFDCSESVESAVLQLAKDEYQKRDIELRTRTRKKIQCSCGAILDDSVAFQSHSVEVEHDEDWSYDCKEIMVEELVSSVSDE